MRLAGGPSSAKYKESGHVCCGRRFASSQYTVHCISRKGYGFKLVHGFMGSMALHKTKAVKHDSAQWSVRLRTVVSSYNLSRAFRSTLQ